MKGKTNGPPPSSQKRNKKLKRERETSITRDRTRSKRDIKRHRHNNPNGRCGASLPSVSHIYKIAILNINGIASNTRPRMHEDLLWRKDVDFALLQEETHANLYTIRNYDTYVNEGMDSRGTAILSKEGQTLSNIKRIPSGRRISTMFKGLWIINISAPSGAEKMKEREELFNIDVTLDTVQQYGDDFGR